METEVIYRVIAEGTSPSGTQLEWLLPDSTTDYMTAQKWADAWNKGEPTDIIGGVVWDIAYYVYGAEVVKG